MLRLASGNIVDWLGRFLFGEAAKFLAQPLGFGGVVVLDGVLISSIALSRLHLPPDLYKCGGKPFALIHNALRHKPAMLFGSRRVCPFMVRDTGARKHHWRRVGGTSGTGETRGTRKHALPKVALVAHVPHVPRHGAQAKQQEREHYEAGCRLVGDGECRCQGMAGAGSGDLWPKGQVTFWGKVRLHLGGRSGDPLPSTKTGSLTVTTDGGTDSHEVSLLSH